MNKFFVILCSMVTMMSCAHGMLNETPSNTDIMRLRLPVSPTLFNGSNVSQKKVSQPTTFFSRLGAQAKNILNNITSDAVKKSSYQKSQDWLRRVNANLDDDQKDRLHLLLSRFAKISRDPDRRSMVNHLSGTSGAYMYQNGLMPDVFNGLSGKRLTTMTAAIDELFKRAPKVQSHFVPITVRARNKELMMLNKRMERTLKSWYLSNDIKRQILTPLVAQFQLIKQGFCPSLTMQPSEWVSRAGTFYDACDRGITSNQPPAPKKQPGIESAVNQARTFKKIRTYETIAQRHWYDGKDLLERVRNDWSFANSLKERTQDILHELDERCFEILSVPANATKKQIDQAYKSLARMCHTDKGGTTERMTELNNARTHALELCKFSPAQREHNRRKLKEELLGIKQFVRKHAFVMCSAQKNWQDVEAHLQDLYQSQQDGLSKIAKDRLLVLASLLSNSPVLPNQLSYYPPRLPKVITLPPQSQRWIDNTPPLLKWSGLQ